MRQVTLHCRFSHFVACTGVVRRSRAVASCSFGSIDCSTDNMDPYSSELRRFTFPVDSALGMDVRKGDDDIWRVESLCRGGMAEMCGIEVGWAILTMNGQPMRDRQQLLETKGRTNHQITFGAKRKKQLSPNIPWAFMGKCVVKKGKTYEIIRLNFTKYSPRSFNFLWDEELSQAVFMGCLDLTAIRGLKLMWGDVAVCLDDRPLPSTDFNTTLLEFDGDVVDMIVERSMDTTTTTLHLPSNVEGNPSARIPVTPTDLLRHLQPCGLDLAKRIVSTTPTKRAKVDISPTGAKCSRTVKTSSRLLPRTAGMNRLQWKETMQLLTPSPMSPSPSHTPPQSASPSRSSSPTSPSSLGLSSSSSDSVRVDQKPAVKRNVQSSTAEDTNQPEPSTDKRKVKAGKQMPNKKSPKAGPKAQSTPDQGKREGPMPSAGKTSGGKKVATAPSAPK